MTSQRSKPSARVVVPRPERVRRVGPSGFGWLDARLHKHGWLERLTSEEVATYSFLCLVANQLGVSWYRRDRIQLALGIREDVLWHTLKRLYALDLVAYRPFSQHASDGFHQVLSLPSEGPPDVLPRLEE